jgi:predicted nucleotidyltransferase
MLGTDMGPVPPNEPFALDFDLPEELIQDAMGRIFCVVCKVYVPRGQMNASQHLSGKKHASCAKLLPAERRVVRREELLRLVEEQKAAGGDFAARPLTAAGACAGSIPKQSGAAATEPVHTAGVIPQMGEEEGKAAALTKAREDALVHRMEREVEELRSSDQHHCNEAPLPSPYGEREHLRGPSPERLLIDKGKFLSSVLGEIESDCDTLESNEEGLNSSADQSRRENSETLQGRSNAFAPIKYKAPADILDIFSDDFVDETPATEKSQTLKRILSGNQVNVTPGSTADQIARRPDRDYISLEPITYDNGPPSISAETRGEDSAIEPAESGCGRGDDADDSAEESSEPALPPWLIGDDAIDAVKYNGDASLALHFEILEFARFISPTQAEIDIRRNLVRTVTSIVHTLWPQSRVEVFGSYAVDLYLPTSDIDICVMNTPEGGGQAPDFAEHLELAQAIRNVKEFARRVNFIKARVPLVKIVARFSNVQCDISFNRTNGPENVPVIRKYLTDYPALRPLLMVLKCFLQQRSLNEVFSGGLGSYSVLLLVVSHLQMFSYNFPGSKANLGMALQHFFHLYGRLFNYCLAGIRVKGGGCYYDKVEKYQTAPNDTLRFSIEDPNDETNELGRNSYAASRIRKAFGNAFIFISKWRRDDQTGPATPLSSILHIDDLQRERRASVEEDLLGRGFSSLQSSVLAGLKNVPRLCSGLDHGQIPTLHGPQLKTTPSARNAMFQDGRSTSDMQGSSSSHDRIRYRNMHGGPSNPYERSAGSQERRAKRLRGPPAMEYNNGLQHGYGYGYDPRFCSNGDLFSASNGYSDIPAQDPQSHQVDGYSEFQTNQLQMAQPPGIPYGGSVGGYGTELDVSWDAACQQVHQRQGQHAQQQLLLQQQQSQLILEQHRLNAADPIIRRNQRTVGDDFGSLDGSGRSWRVHQAQGLGSDVQRGQNMGRSAWNGNGSRGNNRGIGSRGGASRGGGIRGMGRGTRPRRRGG